MKKFQQHKRLTVSVIKASSLPLSENELPMSNKGKVIAYDQIVGIRPNPCLEIKCIFVRHLSTRYA